MRGFIAWLSSKFAILIFAIVIFSSFFVFFGMQTNFEVLDDQARETESLARIIDSVCASPFDMYTIYPLKGDKLVISEQRYLEMHRGGKHIAKAIHCDVQAGTLENVERVLITKTGGVITLGLG